MIIGLVTVLHLLVCLILVLAVLLQSGKSADLAGAFGGGGSQTAFGSRGPATFLSRVTTAAAILFMITSLSLSLFYSHRTSGGGSALPADDPAAAKPAATAPVNPAPAATTPAPAGSAPVTSSNAATVPTPEQKPAANPPKQ